MKNSINPSRLKNAIKQDIPFVNANDLILWFLMKFAILYEYLKKYYLFTVRLI